MANQETIRTRAQQFIEQRLAAMESEIPTDENTSELIGEMQLVANFYIDVLECALPKANSEEEEELIDDTLMTAIGFEDAVLAMSDYLGTDDAENAVKYTLIAISTLIQLDGLFEKLLGHSVPKLDEMRSALITEWGNLRDMPTNPGSENEFDDDGDLAS